MMQPVKKEVEDYRVLISFEIHRLHAEAAEPATSRKYRKIQNDMLLAMSLVVGASKVCILGHFYRRQYYLITWVLNFYLRLHPNKLVENQDWMQKVHRRFETRTHMKKVIRQPHLATIG